ncbi:release factor glutamine methyltransferase [Natronincola peptidivorans]|uniref:Release factor glutamine methyltransferase n=1 Tax=Natronincola peptidivorans TaxID=426128 RepID=A0A1H9ZKZ7_9FIRM|nr:peptide chain release factor N(5)-glutamine methyltransferase [Natronincola peptidivorans]SES82375.1 release factor glutamine methyltransferase [Natronincola peptidivorans]
MITAKEILKEAVEKLKAKNIDTPQLDAEVVLCNLLGIERVKLHIYPEMEISREICHRYWEAVEKRLKHMPVQYIINRQEFMGLDFWVEEGVLIPRGDTEILVEKVIELYRKHYSPDSVKVLDIGVGSGAISVSLAAFIQDCRVTAVDISPKALKVALKNAKTHQVEDKITFAEGSLFTPLVERNKKEGFDFIVSNPPYIPKQIIANLSKEVKDYEPSLALDGGEDGLDFYRKIVEEAPMFLRKEGWLVFEIGHDQGEDLSKIMEKKDFRHIEIIKDLAGLDRVIIGKRDY